MAAGIECFQYLHVTMRTHASGGGWKVRYICRIKVHGGRNLQEGGKQQKRKKLVSPLLKLLMQRSAHVDIVPCSYLIKWNHKLDTNEFIYVGAWDYIITILTFEFTKAFMYPRKLGSMKAFKQSPGDKVRTSRSRLTPIFLKSFRSTEGTSSRAKQTIVDVIDGNENFCWSVGSSKIYPLMTCRILAIVPPTVLWKGIIIITFIIIVVIVDSTTDVCTQVEQALHHTVVKIVNPSNNEVLINTAIVIIILHGDDTSCCFICNKSTVQIRLWRTSLVMNIQVVFIAKKILIALATRLQ